jgi:hypothetical protein
MILNFLSLQERSPFRIFFRSQFPEMRRAVQLDGNVTFDAEKIDNIATYAVLTAEPLTQDLSTLKTQP